MNQGSNLEILIRGLLILDMKKSIQEPHYVALDRISHPHSVIQKRNQYAHEIDRVLYELNLTLELVSTIENSLLIGDKTINPEELIVYYEGIFLDLLHQLKDKLFRLIWWMMQDENSNIKAKEPGEKVDKKVNKEEQTIGRIGLTKLLRDWGQNGDHGIAVALRRRTQHHHFTSNLHLNEDLQKIKITRLMLDPSTIDKLSEYGKVEMSRIRTESLKKYKESVLNKHTSSIQLILQNIEDITGKLVSYYSIPSDEKTIADIANQYLISQKRFDIINSASLSKINPDLEEIINTFISTFRSIPIKAIYLVGSVGRGEFVYGVSDINLIIISDFENEGFFSQQLKKVNPLFNIKHFNKDQFLTDECKKWRFICWADGLLVYGNEIPFDKKDFPKPGGLLAILLNRDAITTLEDVKNKIASVADSDSTQLRHYSLTAVKTMLDLTYGVAITNNPSYTSSRKERIQIIKNSFASLKEKTEWQEMLYQEGLIPKKDFPEVIDSFISYSQRNYQKLLDIESTTIGEDSAI